MGAAQEDGGQEARFRTELMPKAGSWIVVGVVCVLSVAALAAVVDFLNNYQQFAEVTRVLAESTGSDARDTVARSQDLQFAIGTRAMLLGVLVLVTVMLGGVLFLSRYRNLEQLLVERAAEIEEIDKSRRLFFAKASHELRTPVTVILGEAEVALADDPDDPPALRQALDQVATHARFLSHRIEEMVGLARTADGKLHLDAQALDFCDLVVSAIEDARWFARSAGVELELVLPEQPVCVVGDPLWLRRALLAVIENALKFSPIGEAVSVAVSERETFVCITVTDRGPGVSVDELPRVFDAYYQTHSGRERGGSGLGLAMTRWVVEQHGGSASVRNHGLYRRNTGCTVTITIGKERNA